MKTCTIFVLAVVIGIAFAERCHHDDISTCHVACLDPADVVVCDHDVCTCNAAPQRCIQQSDCTAPCPKPDETQHCVDSGCECQKQH